MKNRELLEKAREAVEAANAQISIAALALGVGVVALSSNADHIEDAIAIDKEVRDIFAKGLETYASLARLKLAGESH